MTDLRKFTLDMLKDTLSCARDPRLIAALQTEITRRQKL